MHRQFMVRRLAAVKQRICYIQIFKLIVEHDVPYTVNNNGVFFNMSHLPDDLVRKIDEIIKRCEERKQQQQASYLCITTMGLFKCYLCSVVACARRQGCRYAQNRCVWLVVGHLSPGAYCASP